MISAQLGGFGFSFTSLVKTAVNPIAMTKKSLAVTKQAAKTTGKVVYKASVLPLQYTLIKPTMWLASKATAPIKSRVRKIVSRRAAKIAMDKRKSTTPTPAEYAEAKAWTQHKLTYDGPGGIPTPHGKILALFAGPEYHMPRYTEMGQLGVAPAVVAAAVPVLVALANAMIKKYANSGEAPASVHADAAANAQAPDDAPVTPGTVDLQPVQDAVNESLAPGGAAAGDDGSGAGGGAMTKHKGGHGGKGGLPGGISKNQMLIGGAVIGGLVLIMLLKPKS